MWGHLSILFTCSKYTMGSVLQAGVLLLAAIVVLALSPKIGFFFTDTTHTLASLFVFYIFYFFFFFFAVLRNGKMAYVQSIPFVPYELRRKHKHTQTRPPAFQLHVLLYYTLFLWYAPTTTTRENQIAGYRTKSVRRSLRHKNSNYVLWPNNCRADMLAARSVHKTQKLIKLYGKQTKAPLASLMVCGWSSNEYATIRFVRHN